MPLVKTLNDVTTQYVNKYPRKMNSDRIKIESSQRRIKKPERN
jgi:hypothetical protein